ncbi:MAG: DUF2007 domain-containing protein [Chloroflexi bacterium]|nr:DUF2007 domain-containing protein [Chloroflexota bacterium]
MTSRSWKVVRVESYNLQAEILRGLLESQGIDVVLSSEGYQAALGLDGPPFHRIHILVPETDLQAATRVLADYDSGRLADVGRDDEAG